MDTTEVATEVPAPDTTATATAAAATTTVATTPTDKSTPPPSAVEFEPPLACVRRILKNSLPSSTNVGKDASAAFARACGIFIIYLTACSNDFAREHKRQTITANDVLAAIKVSRN
jgi:histone H3/H4